MDSEIKLIAWDGLRFTTSGIMFNSSTGCIETPIGANMKVLRYTPFKDKNSAEIIEGSICKKDGHTELYTIIFEKGAWAIKTENKKAIWIQQFCLGVNSSQLEVIGHILSTPELLNY